MSASHPKATGLQQYGTRAIGAVAIETKEAANRGGPHRQGSFHGLWRLENGIRQSYPFCRHFTLNGAIFLIRCHRHHLQTMLSNAG
jgi:hypothetical protein